MPDQLSHQETKNTLKTFPIVLMCDGVQSPSNIGALFRICEALGISEIVFCNTELNLSSSRLQKTARSTQKKVSYSVSNNGLEVISKLKKENYKIIALEITNSSVSLKDVEEKQHQKIALVVGNERLGISETILEACDKNVKIEMFGKNSSMNVVQATSIALYTLINKLYIY